MLRHIGVVSCPRSPESHEALNATYLGLKEHAARFPSKEYAREAGEV